MEVRPYESLGHGLLEGTNAIAFVCCSGGDKQKRDVDLSNAVTVSRDMITSF